MTRNNLTNAIIGGVVLLALVLGAVLVSQVTGSPSEPATDRIDQIEARQDNAEIQRMFDRAADRDDSPFLRQRMADWLKAIEVGIVPEDKASDLGLFRETDWVVELIETYGHADLDEYQDNYPDIEFPY